METAFVKYKEKMLKQAEGRQKREKVEDATAALQWLTKTNGKLAAIDTSAWTEEEKTAFTEGLTAIQGKALCFQQGIHRRPDVALR